MTATDEMNIARHLSHIPLKDLKLDDKLNARKAETDVVSLANSISVHGLLIPLIVDDKNKILAGGRRYRALKHNKTPGDHKVPCLVYANGNPLEISMVENVYRVGLHPVDQFEVYVAMIDAGDTVDEVAKRHSTPIAQVRQALALGRLAPEVRQAWRENRIAADVAEVFALTTDHKAQAAALKKAGKHPSEYQIRQLLGGGDVRIGNLVKFVTREAYEAAGFQINTMLFSDDEDMETVSDLPALKRLADEKLAAECERLKGLGWKWAVVDGPKDIHGWKRVFPGGGNFTKEMMANLGCVVKLSWEGKLDVTRGYVKPGDRGVPTPKSPKEKKKEAKAREEKKEITGGLSDALASRLSKQITAALTDAFYVGATDADVLSFLVAALACDDSPLNIRLTTNWDDESKQHENEFVRYYKLAAGKTPKDRMDLLRIWVSRSIETTCHRSTELVALLHPGKDGDRSVAVIAKQVGEKALLAAAREHFDAADYFASVSKELIWQAVEEALGKEHSARVAKMKAGEAREYAIKHVAKTGWVPPAFRL
jgi:ParB family chromosome partitioning protein